MIVTDLKYLRQYHDDDYFSHLRASVARRLFKMLPAHLMMISSCASLVPPTLLVIAADVIAARVRSGRKEGLHISFSADASPASRARPRHAALTQDALTRHAFTKMKTKARLRHCGARRSHLFFRYFRSGKKRDASAAHAPFNAPRPGLLVSIAISARYIWPGCCATAPGVQLLHDERKM